MLCQEFELSVQFDVVVVAVEAALPRLTFLVNTFVFRPLYLCSLWYSVHLVMISLVSCILIGPGPVPVQQASFLNSVFYYVSQCNGSSSALKSTIVEN